jgi:hypothetical protein
MLSSLAHVWDAPGFVSLKPGVTDAESGSRCNEPEVPAEGLRERSGWGDRADEGLTPSSNERGRGSGSRPPFTRSVWEVEEDGGAD